MEVDGDFVDQQLLQQFSCLGTTDKDELVKQLQILVGNNLNASTAKFFLDMNNWNLQAAVGSYFDIEMPVKMPSMSLIRDETSSDNFTVPPSTVVSKMWTLLNNGDELWPQGCYLQFTGGDQMSQVKRIPVFSIEPNQTTQISVQMISPSEPGMYRSKWRLTTPSGSYFGDIIWVIMTVVETETVELAKQLSNLRALGGVPLPQNQEMNSSSNPFGPHPQIPNQFMPGGEPENGTC